MNNFICTVCWDSLQNPNNIRGGIMVTACGHAFHTNCISTVLQNNMGCPICHTIIAVNQMNPLFLPQYNGVWPAYSRMYRHLTLIRNGIALLNVQNARLFIMEVIGNQAGLSIEEAKCVICIESLPNPDEDRGGILVSSCGHLFHTDCILESLRRNPSCPMCRQTIRLFYMNPLYLPERQPHHSHIYNRLTFPGNNLNQFNFQRAHLMIYGDIGNQLNIPRPFDSDEVILNVASRR